MRVELYAPPGYRSVTRERHFFSFAQVYEVSSKETRRRSDAAAKSSRTRVANMRKAMEEADLTIERGKTTTEIFALAVSTHGGNYRVTPESSYGRIEQREIRLGMSSPTMRLSGTTSIVA